MGVILAAPGQDEEVLKVIRDRGHSIYVEDIPVDFQLGTRVGRKCMIEMKVFPQDYVSSWRGVEGRLTRQTISLAANEGPSIMLFVGKLETDREHNIVVKIWRKAKGHGKAYQDEQSTGMTIPEFVGRQLHLAMMGIAPIWVASKEEAGYAIGLIYDEMQQEQHISHLVRPAWSGKHTMPTWDRPQARDSDGLTAEEVIYAFQGFPTVGYTIGKAAWKYFGDFRHFAVADEKQLAQVPRVGPKTAVQISKILKAKYVEFFKDGEKKPWDGDD